MISSAWWSTPARATRTWRGSARTPAGSDVELLERRDLAMLAVQGPQARERSAALLSSEAAWTVMALQPFFGAQLGEWFVARTGYTGEDGFEIMLPAGEAASYGSGSTPPACAPADWRARHAAAGGRHEPVRQGHGRADAPARIGPGLDAWRSTRASANSSAARRSRRSARAAASASWSAWCWMSARCCAATSACIVPGVGEGEVTSGTFSPTLARSIGLARVPRATGGAVQVEVRGRLLPARVVRPPFVRHGKALIPSWSDCIGATAMSKFRRISNTRAATSGCEQLRRWQRRDRHQRSRAGSARRSGVRRAAGGRPQPRGRRGLRRGGVGQGGLGYLCAGRRHGGGGQ